MTDHEHGPQAPESGADRREGLALDSVLKGQAAELERLREALTWLRGDVDKILDGAPVRNFDETLSFVDAALAGSASWRESLSRADLEIAVKAIQDVWIMQADDEPNPNAATLAWRRFRAAASGPPGGEGP